jgi:hypothetical protein
MLTRMKTIYLPGAAISVGAALLAAAATSLGTALWPDPRNWVHVVVALGAVTLYAIFGAAAAAWSRAAGGTRRERLMAALCPAVLHAAIVIPPVAFAAAVELGRHHELARVNPQLIVILALVLVPAAALAAGSTPFLQRETSL